MTTLTISELANVEIDEEFDDNNWSADIDNALHRGFDANYPIVVDEDGIIIDGNHRYIAFKEAGREDELVFCVVYFNDFVQAKKKAIENNELSEFDYNDDYFYNIIRSIAQ